MTEGVATSYQEGRGEMEGQQVFSPFFKKVSSPNLFLKQRVFKKCLIQKAALQELLHFPTDSHIAAAGTL